MRGVSSADVQVQSAATAKTGGSLPRCAGTHLKARNHQEQENQQEVNTQNCANKELELSEKATTRTRELAAKRKTPDAMWPAADGEVHVADGTANKKKRVERTDTKLRGVLSPSPTLQKRQKDKVNRTTDPQQGANVMGMVATILIEAWLQEEASKTRLGAVASGLRVHPGVPAPLIRTSGE